MVCYQALRARRPDLAGAVLLINISDELKRAGRSDQEERFYRDAVAGSTRLGQIVGTLVLAARRGDAAGLSLLFERYIRAQTGRSQLYYRSNTFNFSSPGLALAQGMSALADRKDYTGVLGLVDFTLAFARKKQEQQSPGAAMRALRARYAAQGYTGFVPVSYSIWIGTQSRVVQIPFPQVNEYFDATVLEVLRTAYELYKRDDLLSDLTGHFRRQTTEAATPRDGIYPGLALASLLWWDNEKEEGIAELTKVVDAARSESELRLDLAELLEQQRGYADALAVIDAVQPMDNATLRRREELALRLAVGAGDVERARHAAQRLFGLRLDTDTQVRLAGQMHQLGLHELAEAVLGRARRRAGNKSSALVALMLQYQQQGKKDESTQVAMQILRSTARPAQTTSLRAANDLEAERTAAIGVLAASGRLKELIERANAELKKTPNSLQIHQNLADYYTAARQNDKATAELAKLAELRPDDTGLRIQVANQLARSGQNALAMAFFKTAFKKDPAQIGRAFAQIQTMLLQAGQAKELVQLLVEIDLRSIGNGLTLGRLIQELPQSSELTEPVRSLYRKTWNAFPDQRVQLLVYVPRDDVWQMPEMFDYLREALIPNKLVQVAPAIPWYPFMPVGPGTNPTTGASETVSITPPILRFLDMAAQNDRLEDVTRQVEAAHKALPGWAPADAMLALFHARAGNFGEARARALKFFDHMKTDTVESSTAGAVNALWTVGIELEEHPATRDLAMTAFEDAVGSPFGFAVSSRSADHSPAHRLVDLRLREGRPDKARDALLGMVHNANFPERFPAELAGQYRITGLPVVARELVRLGFASDAVPLFQECLALAAMPAALSNVRLVGADRFSPAPVRDELDRALNGMDQAELAAIAGRSISRAIDGDRARASQDAGKTRAMRPRDQVIDLGPMIHPLELDKATVRSLVAESIAACNADQLAALEEPLESLRKSHPDDLSVAIAIALETLATSDSHRIEPALARLVELVEKSPLESLPPGTRANSRQRAEAARLIPLWLVARACGKETIPTIKETATLLAAHALQAAGRQSEPQWVLAMLREQGQLALEHHDRSAAQAAWSRMLNMVVTPEVTRNQRPGMARPGAAPARSQPPSSTAPRGAEKQPQNKVGDASTSLWHGLPARVQGDCPRARCPCHSPPDRPL